MVSRWPSGWLYGVAVWVGLCAVACSSEQQRATPTAPTTVSGPTAGGTGGSETPPATPPGTPPTTPPPTAPPPPPPGTGSLEPPPVVGSGTAVLVGAGDIGWCNSPGVAATARVLDGIPGTVFILGDAAYMRGSADDFRRCFEPDWGRFRSRWRALPGNHEYEMPLASGYYDYFGDAAGAGRKGWYGFRAATWHVLMLNSSQPMVKNSEQYLWVERELQTNRTRCTAAMWHHPYASSGPNGLNPHARDMWQLLMDHGVEMVVSAHDHFYERYAKQNADYAAADRGIRQFVAGTGGAPLYRPVAIIPNREHHIESFGVLKLTLAPTAYDWEFVEAPSGQSTDRGSTVCH